MSTLSAGLGSAGARHTLIHDGRVYPFEPFGQGMKDAFQKEFYRITREQAAALPEVADARPELREAALERELAALKRQFLAGGFRMESEAGQEFLGKGEGKALLLKLIVRRPDGEDDETFADMLKARGAEVGVLIDQVLCESMPGYAKARARREGQLPGPAEGNARTPPATRPPPGASDKKRRKRGKKTRK
jgi:hypothetical protein